MPIFTAIGGAIAGALFAGAAAISLATTVIAGALAFGAQIALGYLNRPKKRNYSAVQGETQFGGDVPVGTIYGTSKVKGQRVFYAKYGKGNKFNAEVFVLANGWCDGLENYVYFYGKKYQLVSRPIIGNEVAHYGVENFSNNVSIRFFDGRPVQQADIKLVNDTGGVGQTWRASSVGAGLCYVVVERLYNADLFPNGKPDMEFVLRGLREYDPRKDSTVVGGSGNQRLTDPSTWRHTLNPAVHRLNYQLGLRALISSRTLIGEGKTMGQLDLGTYFAAMNVCDTIRAGKPTYQCSLYVNGEDDHTEVLREFDDAMAGYGINRRGLSGVIVGAPQIPVMEITADDLDVGRPKELQFRKSAFDRFNHLAGQFMSIESMWNPQSLDPVVVNADIAADGRNKQATNDFLQVTDPDIAQYLLNIRYRQNRLGGSATIPVSRRVGLKVQEGEWITWRGKTWLITEWSADEQFRFTLKLNETSPAIYDDGDIEPGPIVIPPTAPINPSIITTISGLRVDTGLIEGADGYRQPTLRFAWDAPEDPTITEVVFFYRIAGKTEVFSDVSKEPESGYFETSKDVQSGVFYEGSATITTVPDRFRTTTPWVSSLTATGFSSIKTELADLGEDAQSAWLSLGKEIQDLWKRVEHMGQAFSLEGAVGEVRSSKLTAQVGNNAASITEERRVRIRGDEALAQSINLVEARTGDNEAAIIQEATARTTEDEALATSIEGIRAEFESAFADGLVKFEAVAAPAGVNIRFSILLRASLNDQYLESGQFLDIYTEGGQLRSRAVFVANQFLVSNGGNILQPVFGIVDGVVSIINARIQGAQIDNLTVGTSNIVSGVVLNFTSGSQTDYVSTGTGFSYSGGTQVTHSPNRPALDVIITGSTRGGDPNALFLIMNTAQNGDITPQVLTSQGGFAMATVYRPPQGQTVTTFRVGARKNSSGDANVQVRGMFAKIQEIKQA